ncbi:PepSY domain-containing protein [Nocardioides ochotonae]|uniref:PepSY domain-containing protein n=1 Tax=Nocardioides ochotonae TaxID=2685869 RepID=UPI001A9D173E|nr:PepSY domain-containing protein [Nocardioides ochotonae]
MNTTTLRRKRVVLPTLAVLAAVGIGGTVWTATANESGVDGAERDRVGAAATEAVGGTVVDVETSDDRGETYEVEVRLDDGSEVDLALDEGLAVVAEERDGDDGDDHQDTNGRDTDRDTDDRPVAEADRTAAEKAALGAVEGATVLDVEASDDRGAAWEVEVRDADGAEWDVVLDADFGVLRTDADGTDD